MKFLLTVLVTALLCALSAYFLPWWTVAVISFLVAVFTRQPPGRSFLAGFCGVGALWLVVALFRDIRNDHILSTRMAELFHLSGYNMFIVVTVLVGALVGGLAAWAGGLINRQA
jgi:hypothetical protein